MHYLLGTFGQDDAHFDVLVLDTFGLLRSLQEGHIENVAVAAKFAEEFWDVGVPSYAEWVVPPAKDWVSWLQLEAGLAFVASESGRRDIANHIGKVRSQTADFERELEILERRTW